MSWKRGPLFYDWVGSLACFIGGLLYAVSCAFFIYTKPEVWSSGPLIWGYCAVAFSWGVAAWDLYWARRMPRPSTRR